jgi:hypothetical protein
MKFVGGGGDYLFTRYQNGGGRRRESHTHHSSLIGFFSSPSPLVFCGLLWYSFLYPLKCGFIEWEGKRKNPLLLEAWISPWMGHFSVVAAKGGKGASGCIEQLLLRSSSALPCTNSLLVHGLVFHQARQFPSVFMRLGRRAFTLTRSFAHSDSHVCLFARLPFLQVSRVSAAKSSESCFSASSVIRQQVETGLLDIKNWALRALIQSFIVPLFLFVSSRSQKW